MNKFTRKVKRAFTLIELVVVIAVIAILSAVSVGTYFGVMNNAKLSAARQEAVQLRTALRAETVDGVELTNQAVATLVPEGILIEEGTTAWVEKDFAAFEGYIKEIYTKFATTSTTAEKLPGEVTITNIYLKEAFTITANKDKATLIGFELDKGGVKVQLGIVEDAVVTTNALK